MNGRDQVATVLKSIQVNDEILVGNSAKEMGLRLSAIEAIAIGHKVALIDLETGC